MGYYDEQENEKPDIYLQLQDKKNLELVSEIMNEAAKEIQALRKRINVIENKDRHLYVVSNDDFTSLERYLINHNNTLKAEQTKNYDNIERIKQLGDALTKYIRCEWSCSSQRAVHFGCSCGAEKALSKWMYEFSDWYCGFRTQVAGELRQNGPGILNMLQEAVLCGGDRT